jgi:hypothetical protein
MGRKIVEDGRIAHPARERGSPDMDVLEKGSKSMGWVLKIYQVLGT